MEIRNPKQKRAIEKKRKIIEVGFNLMCEKGYHNVNTNDIAKEAGLSVGILYQYFKEKKEIFTEGIKMYSEQILFPISSIIEKEDIDINNIESILNMVIEILIKNHNISKKAHQEITSLQHIDEDIEQIFLELELKMTNKICELLRKNNINIKNLEEKIHISYNLIESYCHEVAYHKHKDLDYKIMKTNVIKMISNILK